MILQIISLQDKLKHKEQLKKIVYVLSLMKVLVICDRFLTDVAHGGTTWTCHLIATILDNEPLLTFVAGSKNEEMTVLLICKYLMIYQ